MAHYDTDDPNVVIDADFRPVDPDSDTASDSPYEYKRKRRTRSDKGVARGPRGSGGTRTRSTKTVSSDQVLASLGYFMWSGPAWAIGHYAPDPPGGATSRVMMLQSAYAGEVLRDAFKQTPYYPIVKPWLETVGPWRDLAQLVALPIMVAAISYRPQVLANPALVGLLTQQLVPVLVAAKKRAEEQAKLMEEMGEVTEEAQAEVAAALAWLINGDSEQKPTETQNASPRPEPATA